MQGKKIMALIGVIALAGVCVVGCGKKDEKKKTEAQTFQTEDVQDIAEESTEAEDAEVADNVEGETGKAVDFAAIDFNSFLVEAVDSYVTLADASGFDVKKPKYVITDETVDAAIDEELSYSSEYEEVDRAAAEWDTVVMDITATVDGAEDAETAEYSENDIEILLGAEYFGTGVDEEIIGISVGEDKEFTVTFAEDDDTVLDECWKGQTVKFNVTANAVQTVVSPELTDEWVAENTEYTTVDEYKEARKAELESNYESRSFYDTQNAALMAIVEASEFSGCPEDLLHDTTEHVNDHFNDIADMYGLEVDELFDAFGLTEEDIKDEINTEVNMKIAISAICEKNDLVPTAEEVEAQANEKVYSYGYSSVDEMISEYGMDNFVWDVFAIKAADWICEKANITEELRNVDGQQIDEDSNIIETVVEDEFDDEVAEDADSEDVVLDGVEDLEAGTDAFPSSD